MILPCITGGGKEITGFTTTTSRIVGTNTVTLATLDPNKVYLVAGTVKYEGSGGSTFRTSDSYIINNTLTALRSSGYITYTINAVDELKVQNTASFYADIRLYEVVYA